jgi:ribosome-binding protein aMBF1 (putative translation factor)
MIRSDNDAGAAVSPLGTTATAARRRRAARSPEYAREWEAQTASREIAWQLIQFRMENDLTQQQLAERAQTSHSQISRLESGEHLPSLASLGKLANALGLKLNVTFERYDAEVDLHMAD